MQSTKEGLFDEESFGAISVWFLAGDRSLIGLALAGKIGRSKYSGTRLISLESGLACTEKSAVNTASCSTPSRTNSFHHQ